MPTYKFDVGNSNTGNIGFVARVVANDPEQAVERLQAFIGDMLFDEFEIDSGSGQGIEYLTVYFNSSNLTIKEIDMGETDGEDEDTSMVNPEKVRRWSVTAEWPVNRYRLNDPFVVPDGWELQGKGSGFETGIRDANWTTPPMNLPDLRTQIKPLMMAAVEFSWEPYYEPENNEDEPLCPHGLSIINCPEHRHKDEAASGQDRKGYTDDQDRDSYVPDPGLRTRRNPIDQQRPQKRERLSNQ